MKMIHSDPPPILQDYLTNLEPFQPLERRIEDHIAASKAKLQTSLKDSFELDGNHRLGIIKYIQPKFLDSFLHNGNQLHIASRGNYTWGTSLYVTPLQYPKSTMMYGRVGILGYVNINHLRAFDAVDDVGVALYQQWIRHQLFPYMRLTTTIHATQANHILRERFKRNFNIDIIFFRPDEQAKGYTDHKQDIWLAIYDRHKGSGGFTNMVSDCRWVSIVSNEFSRYNYGGAALLPSSPDYVVSLFPDAMVSGSSFGDIYSQSYDNNGLIHVYLEAYQSKKVLVV